MKRLYFLVPNVDSASAIVSELQGEDIPHQHIHLVCKDYSRLDRSKGSLHATNVLQETDIVNALEKGAIAGGTVGLIAGISAVIFPPMGLVFGGGAVLGLSMFGAGFGAWVSSMVGISISNPAVDKYERAIEAGNILILVDVPKEKATYLSGLIKKHHPEVIIESIYLHELNNKVA